MDDQRCLALSSHRWLRATVLCLLYFCQGFPWGFATIALLATLSAAGHGKADTATVTALSILPWTFKFFWGPMIDSLRMPSFGLRRPWIVFAQLGMAVTLLGPVTSGSISAQSTLVYLAWVYFVHNCFASLQDVAADALAVDLLEPGERGRVISWMWASKLAGVAVGGAGMAIVAARAGLATAMLLQIVIVLAVCALVIMIRERPNDRLFPWSARAGLAPAEARPFGLMTTFRELRRALAHRTSFTLVFVAGTYLICEGLYDPVVTEFFVQELGWAPERFSTMQGTLGVSGELCGALLGGYLSDRFGRRRTARLGMTVLVATLVGFGATAALWTEPGYPFAILFPAVKGSIAFTTVSLFALYVKVSWTTAAATQYTLYMTMGNVGYALGARLIGWLEAAGSGLDTAGFFIVAGLSLLLPLALLVGLDPDDIAARRQAEEAALAAAA